VLILALDTTTRTGSVAVLQDDEVLAERSGDAALTHGQQLPGALMHALADAGARLEEVDLLAVAAGPGSFTGLRVGIASMQGIAFARGLKIVPVSTLDALAHETVRVRPSNQARLASWMDAQRGEVFAALYDASAQHTLEPPSSRSPADTLHEWQPALGTNPVVFAGDGAVRYHDTIVATLGPQAAVIERVPLLAAALARIAARDPERAVLPHAVVPIYVRRPDAELARNAASVPKMP
jgi:tRNA threonylcarbamoyladenosine biosynthesis protein TsaB